MTVSGMPSASTSDPAEPPRSSKASTAMLRAGNSVAASGDSSGRRRRLVCLLVRERTSRMRVVRRRAPATPRCSQTPAPCGQAPEECPEPAHDTGKPGGQHLGRLAGSATLSAWRVARQQLTHPMCKRRAASHRSAAWSTAQASPPRARAHQHRLSRRSRLAPGKLRSSALSNSLRLARFHSRRK